MLLGFSSSVDDEIAGVDEPNDIGVDKDVEWLPNFDNNKSKQPSAALSFTQDNDKSASSDSANGNDAIIIYNVTSSTGTESDAISDLSHDNKSTSTPSRNNKITGIGDINEIRASTSHDERNNHQKTMLYKKFQDAIKKGK